MASAAATQESPSASKATYLVVYHHGPGWVAGKPLAEQPLKEHGKYMLSLYSQGVLKQAGPFLDDAGGAVVFEAANGSEANMIVANDPAVVAGVFVGELHPWRPVDWAQHIKK
jgi:uncharacterized protein YciI